MKSPNQYKIRHENIDLEKIIQLRLESLRSDPDWFGEKFVDASSRSTSDWQTWLAERTNDKNKIFVIESEDKYFGMCGIAIDIKSFKGPYLWGLYTLPFQREKGLASFLITVSIDYLKQIKESTVTARVDDKNKNAFAFYKKRGFEITNSDSQLIEMKLKF